MWAPLVRATPTGPCFLVAFASCRHVSRRLRKPATSLSAVLATLMLFETVAALAMPFAPVRVWADAVRRGAGAGHAVRRGSGSGTARRAGSALAMPVAAVTGTVMLAAAALALDARFVQAAVTVSLCR